MWVRSMDSTTSRLRPHRVVWLPASARIIANVVPHDPVPTTAIFAITSPPFGFVAGLRRLLAPELGELRGDGLHDVGGRLPQDRRVRRPVGVLGQVDRLAHHDAERLAREQAGL